MYGPFTIFKKYLRYRINASNAKGHGVHSPFVFDFIKNVLNDKEVYDCYAPIEAERKRLLKDHTLLHVEDHGAGSVALKSSSRPVYRIARTSLKPAKYGKLLFRICKHYNISTVLELGTSLGITTAYLASGSTTVHTIEGAAAVGEKAGAVWKNLNLNNINLHLGTFSRVLPSLLQEMKSPQLVFIDGDHRYASTVKYFEMLLEKVNDDAILVFDDIHWSDEMEKAWQHITAHPQVTLSIDLFFIGLVFFRKEFKERQHFSIIF